MRAGFHAARWCGTALPPRRGVRAGRGTRVFDNRTCRRSCRAGAVGSRGDLYADAPTGLRSTACPAASSEPESSSCVPSAAPCRGVSATFVLDACAARALARAGRACPDVACCACSFRISPVVHAHRSARAHAPCSLLSAHVRGARRSASGPSLYANVPARVASEGCAGSRSFGTGSSTRGTVLPLHASAFVPSTHAARTSAVSGAARGTVWEGPRRRRDCFFPSACCPVRPACTRPWGRRWCP